MAGRLFKIGFGDLEGPHQVFGKDFAKMRVGDIQICKLNLLKSAGHRTKVEVGFDRAPDDL